MVGMERGREKGSSVAYFWVRLQLLRRTLFAADVHTSPVLAISLGREREKKKKTENKM